MKSLSVVLVELKQTKTKQALLETPRRAKLSYKDRSSASLLPPPALGPTWLRRSKRTDRSKRERRREKDRHSTPFDSNGEVHGPVHFHSKSDAWGRGQLPINLTQWHACRRGRAIESSSNAKGGDAVVHIGYGSSMPI